MKQVKKFIVYFPVILVALQVVMNVWALIDRPAYDAAGFYLSTFLGTNILFAVFLLCFTWAFNFCRISRWAAVAEFLFGVAYLVIREDNIYNILFQIIVGCIALGVTFSYFINKFPLCKISLLCKFIIAIGATIFVGGKCRAAVDSFDTDVKNTLIKKMYPDGQHIKQHS